MGIEIITFYSCDNIVGIDVSVELLEQHKEWYLYELYRNHKNGEDSASYTIITSMTSEEILNWNEYIYKKITIIEPRVIVNEERNDVEEYVEEYEEGTDYEEDEEFEDEIMRG
jgi:hypothetical protein